MSDWVVGLPPSPGETIYGTRGGPMPPQEWGVMTRKGEIAYIEIELPPEQRRPVDTIIEIEVV